ncbi:MAG: OsmC family protein, partial [Caldilineaceae bacterium]|nr:OsmC family protein [Caldilineaceae bacterium]
MQRKGSKQLFNVAVVVALLLTLVAVPFGSAVLQAQEATPTPAAEEESAAMDESTAGESMETEEGMEEDVQLVTATAFADLVRPGRVLMSARGNHWIYDSVPPIDGPNEEVNPLDAMLGALLSCALYIYEAEAVENHIAFNHASGRVSGEFDPRGVAGADVNPRVRAFNVTINVEGPDVEQAAAMADSVSRRCPIFTTLNRSAPITVTNIVYGQAQEPVTFPEEPLVEDTTDESTLELARPSAQARMIETGRSLVSARGNHWIYDSVPPIFGPNEEVNPLDGLIGALPACGIMIYEAVANEEGISLNSINATVEADLDPRGVAGADVNPRIRAFRVTMNVDGPTAEEAEMMAEQYSRRCPIYTTFERAAPIEVT